MKQQAPWELPSKPKTLSVNTSNIPEELKAIPRWLVWKAEPKKNGKINKPPYQGRFPGTPASTNNPGHLCDFETACIAYKQNDHIAGIGFVAEPEGGLVFVDIDDCVSNGEIDDDAFNAIRQFMSYAEYSPSGNGIRIVAKGAIKYDFNNNELGREMYGGNGTRYLTFTGQVVEDSIHTIEPAQDAISFYFEKWKTNPVKNRPKVDNIEVVENVDLSRLKENVYSAITNAEHIRKTYSSRDKAIYAVAIEMLGAGYTQQEIVSVLSDPNNAISEGAFDRRKTRESAKEWIATYPLAKAIEDHSMKPPVIDFKIGAEEKTTKEKPATETDSTVPRELLTPPGLVGEIAKEIFENAIRPQEMFAVSGALAAVSVASQNYFRCAYMGGSINLYMVQVGGTASGKDGPRKAIKTILSEANLSNLVPESVASGAALLRSLSKNSVLGYMPDEFGLMLQTALNDRGSVHLKDMVSELMRLYSLGNSMHTGKKYAREEDEIKEIRRPFVNMFGSTTPDELVSAISISQVNNGFLNRILYIEAEHEKPPKQRRPKCSFSPEIIRKIKAITERFGGIPSSVSAPVVITFDLDAEKILDDFDDKCDDLHDGEFGPIWSRAHENAIRVAGILAVGMSRQPNVTAEIARWAIQFVEWCTRNMITHLRENMAGSQFEADAKKALRFISSAKKYEGDRKFGAYCAQDVMPRGLLVRLMHMPSRHLDQVIDHLTEGQHIERGEAKDKEKQRPVTVYRVSK